MAPPHETRRIPALIAATPEQESDRTVPPNIKTEISTSTPCSLTPISLTVRLRHQREEHRHISATTWTNRDVVSAQRYTTSPGADSTSGGTPIQPGTQGNASREATSLNMRIPHQKRALLQVTSEPALAPNNPVQTCRSRPRASVPEILSQRRTPTLHTVATRQRI